MKNWDFVSIAIILVMVTMFICSFVFEPKAKFLNDGRKFVTVGYCDYVLGEWIMVEKLPNGFYQKK